MVEVMAVVNQSDGRVENVIMYDIAGSYAQPSSYMLVPVVGSVAIGDWYLNAAFVPNAIQATMTPISAAIGEVVTVTASVPPNTTDSEVTFQVKGGGPNNEPLAGSQASHSYVFNAAGFYQVEVSSISHGRTTVGVIVQ